MSEGLHPRIIAEGFDLAKKKALEVLDEVKVQCDMDRDALINVARTALRTKLAVDIADKLTEVKDLIINQRSEMLRCKI